MLRVRLCKAAIAGLMVAGAAGAFGLAAAFAQSSPPLPGNPAAVAQEERGGPPLHSLGEQPGLQQKVEQYSSGNAALIQVPVSGQFPGGVSTRPSIKNPVGDDPAAAQRGMSYFMSFNCIGCHADNGGGGMGRALSNRYFQYGSDPANIYLSIVQGRPNGMPAWGGILPDAVVWDLVAYIEQISNAPEPQWGTTVNLHNPGIEQVPAEYLMTTNPWAYTEPFSNGQKPTGPGK